MRRAARGMSTFTVGVVALVVIASSASTSASRSRSRSRSTTRSRRRSRARTTCASRLARADRRRRGRQGHEGRARREGDDGAVVTMRIQDKGRRSTRDAQLKIRPRIFLEGNFFVDVSPGSPSAPELADGETIPVNQTATPVQLDQVLDRAADRHARGPQDAAARVRRRPARARAPRASTARSSTGSRPTGTRRSSTRRRSASSEHDLSGYIDGAGAVAGGAGPQPASSSRP